MDLEEIKQRFFAAKAGVLDYEQLIRHCEDEEVGGVWFSCPCGSDNHLALIRWLGLSRCLSNVLTCFVTDQQWLVRMPEGPDPAGIVKGEEEKYLRLLERAPAIVEKAVCERGWSAETLAYLHDTHGIDLDTARSVMELN